PRDTCARAPGPAGSCPARRPRRPARRVPDPPSPGCRADPPRPAPAPPVTRPAPSPPPGAAASRSPASGSRPTGAPPGSPAPPPPRRARRPRCPGSRPRPRGRRAALARRAAAAPPVRPGRPSRLPIARAPTGSATAIHHAISRHGRACPPHGRPGPAASGCFPCPSRYVHRDAGRNDHVRRPPRALTRPRRRPILSTVTRGPSRHPCEAPVKILCTGDVHIGRSSTRFRGDPDARALSCAGAWSLIVDRAIAERVDLVAVSGDLVDRANRYFEAYGPLERGLERLKEA